MWAEESPGKGFDSPAFIVLAVIAVRFTPAQQYLTPEH